MRHIQWMSFLVRACVAAAMFTFPAAALADDPAYTQRVITGVIFEASCVFGIDLDQDGDGDIVTTGEELDQIEWYENLGGAPAAFARHIVDIDPDGNRFGPDDGVANVPRAVTAADIDGDLDLDLVTVSSGDDSLIWWENTGGDPFVFMPHEIVSGPNQLRDVDVADLDDDGDVDIVLAARLDDEVLWIENLGGSPLTFAQHSISTNTIRVRHTHIADVDDDGDLDVLSASSDDNKIAWHENDGMTPPGFTERIITTDAMAATDVWAGDMDGDGDMDVTSTAASEDEVAWYESDGGMPPSFTKRIIAMDPDGGGPLHGPSFSPVSQMVADFNDDGDLDVLVGSVDDDGVTLYFNDGGSPPSFTVCVVTNMSSTPLSVHGVDINGDGAPDPLSIAHQTDDVSWYEVPPPPCPWDLDASGDVGSADLASLVGFWGQAGVAADFDGGGVGSSDLATLIGRWGPCP